MRAARSALIAHHLGPLLRPSFLISGVAYMTKFNKQFLISSFRLAALFAISTHNVAQPPQQEIDLVDQTRTHHPRVARLNLFWRRRPSCIDPGGLSQRFDERDPV